MIFCRFEKIYRNKNCRVAMTTTYENTSCNSENIVTCLVSGEGLLHACISSRLSNCEIEIKDTHVLSYKHTPISLLCITL